MVVHVSCGKGDWIFFREEKEQTKERKKERKEMRKREKDDKEKEIK